jgi:hypothetical protein
MGKERAPGIPGLFFAPGQKWLGSPALEVLIPSGKNLNSLELRLNRFLKMSDLAFKMS